MPSTPVVISFGDTTTAEGNRFAGSLAETLRGLNPTIQVERIRERPDTQDFGASLAVILGTAAVVELAKGIASWLARNSGSKIEIRREGQVVMFASHLDSVDVPKLAEALRAAGLSNG
jgi:acetylornithine deacetylase/succinyl-diaminopimelate desuccinylase-like protein